MWYWTNGIEKRHRRFGYRERFRRNVVGDGDLDLKAARLRVADIEALRVPVHLLKSSASVIQADAEIRACVVAPGSGRDHRPAAVSQGFHRSLMSEPE